MFVADVILALLVGLAFAAILVALARWSPRPTEAESEAPAAGPAFLFFFIVIFLAAWAGGLWLAPFGPAVWEVTWLPFVVVGLIVALMLAAASASSPYGRARVADEQMSVAAAAFGVFFWVLLVVLAGAIVIAYFA